MSYAALMKKPERSVPAPSKSGRLFIKEPNDSSEREADRVANTVMTGGTAQWSRAASGAAQPGYARQVVDEVLRSPGQPLDASSRASFETCFGHDFSRVRIHTDARAAESAHAVHALAYTRGNDVVFAAGWYAPETQNGRRLLAHELAHAMQQSGSPKADTIHLKRDDDKPHPALIKTSGRRYRTH